MFPMVAITGPGPMFIGTDPFVVLILEDAPRLRQRLVEMINTVDGIDTLLEAGDAPTALAMARRYKPHVVVLDIRVPGDSVLRSGLDVLREIKKIAPRTCAIVLTNLSSPPYAEQARLLGADAFLDKTTDLDQLVPVLERLMATWT